MATILLIEDDELIQRMYQQMLQMHGHEVKLAMNGEEGLAQAIAIKPTLILLDIMMPKMNGIDMLRKLRATPGLAHTPVMMLTNIMGAADAQATRDAGALKYVIKSDYTPNEVADIVDELLKSLKSSK